MIFKALSILLFLLLSADAAYAGPVGAAVAAIGSFFATGIGSVVARVAVGYGFSLLQKALTGKSKTAAVGQVLEIKMGEDQPMSFIIGSRAVGGRRKYIGTWGSDGKTPNAFLTDVIELANLPSYAGPQGLNSLWIDDKKCTVDWASPHADGRGYPVKEFRKSGRDYLWIKYYDGTQTAADSFLVAKFGGNADRPYGPDRIGLGVQYVILTARYNPDLFSGMPTGIYEPKPLRFYDPRKDSTNGGVGAHRWGNPATYEATLNPITAAYNIVRGIYFGSDWFYGGQNIAAHRLPNASWFAAANECDRVINGVAQFRCGLEVTLDTEPLDALEDLRVACAGRFAEVGGFIKPLVGAPGSAVYSFDDGGIVVTKDQDFEPFPSLKSTHNRVTGTYPEPAEKWATKDAPENRNLTLEAEDGNRSLPVSVAFNAVPYSDQVQALIKTMVQEQRRFRTHVVTLPPSAAALEPNDVVAWTSDRNAYSNKKFLVTANNGQAGMLRQVSLTEIDPTDYDPPEIIVAPVIGWTGPVLAPIQAATGFQATAGSVTDANSLQRRPAIVVSCDADLDDVARVWVQIRVKSTGVIVLDTDALPYGAPATWTLSGSWCLAVTEYEVSGKLVPVTSRETARSPWISVTTLNLSESNDVLDGSIVSSKIAAAAVTASKIMDEAVTSLKLADAAVSTAKLQVAAVTADILATGAVIASKIADGAINAAKFASSIEPVTIVSALPTDRSTAYVSYNGQAYRWNGSAYVSAVAASEITGQVTAAQIASVNAGAIAGQVVATQIADNSISTAKLIAGSVTTAMIATGAVQAGNIAAGAVIAGKLAANSVVSSNIVADAVTATQIAAGAVSTDELAANAITASKLSVIDTTNYVADPFVAEAAVWNLDSGVTIDTNTPATQVLGTTNGVRIPFISALYPGAVYAKRIPFEAGAVLRLYCRVRTGPAFRGFPKVVVAAIAQDGTAITYLWVGNATFLTATSTTAVTLTIEGQVTLPANTAFIQPFFQIDFSGAGSTGFAVMSDMRVMRAATATLIVDGAIVAGKIAANAVTAEKISAGAITAEKIVSGAVTADKIAASSITGDKIAANTIGANNIAAGAITAKQLVLTDFSNMVDNGWQTGSLAGWTISGYVDFFLENNGNPSDGWLFKSNERDQAYSSRFAVTPGEVYYFEVWVYNISGYTANLFAVAETAANTTGVFAVVASTTTQNAWVRLQARYTVPSGRTKLRMLLQTDRAAGSGGNWAAWSKPVVRRAASGELIVDGAITADKLSVNSLSAVTGNLGVMTAGIAQSSDGKLVINFNAGSLEWYE